jgi:hypothetical protein
VGNTVLTGTHLDVCTDSPVSKADASHSPECLLSYDITPVHRASPRWNTTLDLAVKRRFKSLTPLELWIGYLQYYLPHRYQAWMKFELPHSCHCRLIKYIERDLNSMHQGAIFDLTRSRTHDQSYHERISLLVCPSKSYKSFWF